MSRITKALLITAVAVMLMAATSAYGYYEDWDGWFNSGELTYNSTKYTVVWSVLECDDATYIVDRRDTFGIGDRIPAVAFWCVAGGGDTIFVYIAALTGGKEYGTSGTHEGEGYWDGDGFRYNEEHRLVKIFDFWGTWASTGNHFNYDSEPDPTYTADWLITGSSPLNVVTGDGTCSGYRTYYKE